MKKLLSIISIFFLISTQISVAEPSKNPEWCAKGVKSSDYLACRAGPVDTNKTTGLAVGAVVLGAIAVGIIDHEDDDNVTCEQTANGLVCSSVSADCVVDQTTPIQACADLGGVVWSNINDGLARCFCSGVNPGSGWTTGT